MRSLFLRLCQTALLLFITLFGHAQAGGFDTLFTKLSTNYPQEKIYIHYDRPYYNPGETIWFKAYLFSANHPSPISSTLYTELLDDRGNVLERKTLPVVSSSAASSFELSDSLEASMVYVRAYTAWMLNFDSAFIYLKPFHIIRKDEVAKKPGEPGRVIRFFPEGGDLVKGLPCRTAFKITDDKGMPVYGQGEIMDSRNQKITSFTALHDGMGYFDITPLAGAKYKAVWKDDRGMSFESELPAAKPEGVVLHVENFFNEVSYTVRRSAGVPEDQKVLRVVAQMQQKLVYMATINMTSKTEIHAPLDVSGLEDGILQVTVLSASGKPLAERIIFLNNNNYYFITDLHATETNLTKKGKNILQVDVGDTLLTNLSISVTDAATVGSETEENIYSQVLLSSDIKGYVHNPAYYFSPTNDSTQEYLDLVMMTNGWRRFNWDKILAGQWPELKYLPDPYITVRGQVFGIRNNMLNGRELTAIVQTKNDNKQFFTTPFNSKGEFEIPSLFFYDTAKLYYQINNDKDKVLSSAASFTFKNAFVSGIPRALVGLRPVSPPVFPDPVVEKKNADMTQLRKDEFIEGRKVIELQGVEVKARQISREQQMDEEYASGFFKGGDGYTFLTEGDPFANSAQTVLDYLRGKVAGLQISTGMAGQGSVSWRGGTPTLFLNEMQTDISLVQSTPMADVAMIKVFRPPFMGAAGGGSGGAIAIYTKKGAAAAADVKGLDFFSVPGYSEIKEFYSPDYDGDADKVKGDFRTTLYWSPFLVFDKNTRRILVPFFNNDSCKKIRVVIEGVNELGKLTREEKFFE